VNKGTGKSARRTRRNNPGEAGDSVRDYRYDESKRLHNPPAGLTGQKPTMAAEGPPQVSYDPHKPPVLRFDPSGAVDRKHKGHESLPFGKSGTGYSFPLTGMPTPRILQPPPHHVRPRQRHVN